jgi:hypothetical protein
MSYAKGDAFVLDKEDFYLALGHGGGTYSIGGIAEATQLGNDLIYMLEGIFAGERKAKVTSEVDQLKDRVLKLEKLLLRILAESEPQVFKVVMRQALKDEIRETLLEGIDVEPEEVAVT